jgi:hypothetical protein
MPAPDAGSERKRDFFSELWGGARRNLGNYSIEGSKPRLHSDGTVAATVVPGHGTFT